MPAVIHYTRFVRATNTYASSDPPSRVVEPMAVRA